MKRQLFVTSAIFFTLLKGNSLFCLLVDLEKSEFLLLMLFTKLYSVEQVIVQEEFQLFRKFAPFHRKIDLKL